MYLTLYTTVGFQPQVAKYFHRSRSWACQWLKRYDRQGLDGLKDIPKSGRPTELPEEIEYEIKTILTDSNQGWTTKQVEELITKESGIRYHSNHIYRILRRWGLKQKVPRKVHINTASAEEKDEFKKRSNKYLWTLNTKKKKRKDFTVVSLDESFFFYDSLVRKV